MRQAGNPEEEARGKLEIYDWATYRQ